LQAVKMVTAIFQKGPVTSEKDQYPQRAYIPPRHVEQIMLENEHSAKPEMGKCREKGSECSRVSKAVPG
jgi:hypothetical protein